MSHEHSYRIYDDVGVMMKWSTYLSKSINMSTIDKTRRQTSYVVIWSLAALQASASLSLSFMTLNFSCSSYFKSLSLAETKDLFMALYLSFLNLSSYQHLIHNNNLFFQTLDLFSHTNCIRMSFFQLCF